MRKAAGFCHCKTVQDMENNPDYIWTALNKQTFQLNIYPEVECCKIVTFYYSSNDY